MSHHLLHTVDITFGNTVAAPYDILPFLYEIDIWQLRNELERPCIYFPVNVNENVGVWMRQSLGQPVNLFRILESYDEVGNFQKKGFSVTDKIKMALIIAM